MKTSADIIFVCGSALMGKTSVARFLGNALGIHVLDIDDLRSLCFGPPQLLATPEESHELHLVQLRATYALFYLALEQQISLVGRPIIATAGLSRYSTGQVSLMALVKRLGARLRVVWLHADPSQMTDAEVEQLIRKRTTHDVRYAGGLGITHGVEAFRNWHATFEAIRIPGCLALETWPHHTLEETCATALAYARDPTTGCVL